MTFNTAREALDKLTRHVPGFPEEGVVFEDLTPVFADAKAFTLVIDELAEFSQRFGGEVVAGLDARGFLVGSAVAYKLGQGCLAVRKKGKLPPPVITEEYTLEYGSAALEIPAEGIDIKGKKIVLIDDVLATGGTLMAATELVRQAGGEVVGYVVILEVEGLGGREKLGNAPLLVLSTDGE